MLEVDDLVVRYGPFLALDGITIKVEPGEIVGVIGPNGAGKSSLARAIGGLVAPAGGSIRFLGESLQDMPAHHRVTRGLSLVPEGRGLFPQMSVEENLMMGGYSLASPALMAGVMERCFELFPALKARRRQIAGTMSGGQQQMVAIGRALMSRPKALLLDEPSLGLAPLVVKQVFEVIERINKAGTTVLLAEQNAYAALRIASRAYVIEGGRIVMEGSREELLNNEAVRKAYIGA